MGYRAFIDGLIDEGVMPGSEEMGRREDEWRRSRANSMNPPSAEAMLAPDRPGPFGGGAPETILEPLIANRPGPFGGGGDNDLSERLLGFGRKKRRTQYRRKRC